MKDIPESTTKRWEVDPHPEGLSVHLEPWDWDDGTIGEQPSYYLDPEQHSKADAEKLARRLNEHAEMLAALRACVAHFDGAPADYSSVHSVALRAIDSAEAP